MASSPLPALCCPPSLRQCSRGSSPRWSVHPWVWREARSPLECSSLSTSRLHLMLLLLKPLGAGPPLSDHPPRPVGRYPSMSRRSSGRMPSTSQGTPLLGVTMPLLLSTHTQAQVVTLAFPTPPGQEIFCSSIRSTGSFTPKSLRRPACRWGCLGVHDWRRGFEERATRRTSLPHRLPVSPIYGRS